MISLPKDESNLVRLYIEFLYVAEYEPRLPDRTTFYGVANITLPSLHPSNDPEQLLLHAKMYAMGDKFDTPGLK